MQLLEPERSDKSAPNYFQLWLCIIWMLKIDQTLPTGRVRKKDWYYNPNNEFLFKVNCQYAIGTWLVLNFYIKSLPSDYKIQRIWTTSLQFQVFLYSPSNYFNFFNFFLFVSNLVAMKINFLTYRHINLHFFKSLLKDENVKYWMKR